MKKLLSLVLMVCMIGMLAGCSGVQTEEGKYTEELMTNAYDTVGFPDVTNYFERSQLKEIYEMRDNPNLVCYWYTTNEMTGKYIYQGTCVGYGIPYTTSMTATDSYQRIETGTGYTYEILPLAEPNGLYSSASTSATWVLTTDEDGNISPTYVEDNVTVSQIKKPAYLCEDWSVSGNY